VFLARHADWEVGGEVAVMTATLDDVTKKRAEESAEQQAARELVAIAREQGLSLTGPDGLLKQLTKTVIETALSEEMTEHLGHPRHGEPVGGNIRNGTRAKTVLTDASGHVQIEVPRDRAGTFEPQIVKKRQRRLGGVDEVVLSLYAKGGEISAHFAEREALVRLAARTRAVDAERHGDALLDPGPRRARRRFERHHAAARRLRTAARGHHRRPAGPADPDRSALRHHDPDLLRCRPLGWRHGIRP
jgi:hypothetical protein